MKPIIEINHLSKKYRYGESQSYYTLRDSLVNFAKHPFGIGGKHIDLKKDEFWALKDISFKVNQGEAVGVIGPNGAGKSTLLKILSRITPPTSGEAILRGRVGSLLEVGTGFQQELTGRENIYLNGAILGMKRVEISKKFDEIVDFSGVEKFLDTPVKHYSSGMYMRLAFAVAANLDSDILIVDEVLAVGDSEFQKKCLGKMNDVTSKEGRTVIFVSHNINAVKQLCSNSFVLKCGKVVDQGETLRVVEKYEHSYSEVVGKWTNNSKNKNDIYIKKIEIKDLEGVGKKSFLNSESVIVEITVGCNRNVKDLKVGFDLIKDGLIAFRSQQIDSTDISSLTQGSTNTFCCEIPGFLLNAGDYFIAPLLSVHLVESFIGHEVVAGFTIFINAKKSRFHEILNNKNNPGAIFPLLKWSIK